MIDSFSFFWSLIPQGYVDPYKKVTERKPAPAPAGNHNTKKSSAPTERCAHDSRDGALYSGVIASVGAE